MKEKDMRKELALKITVLRQKANMKQYELAKKAGLVLATMNRLEAGTARLSLVDAKKLADVFGLESSDDFLLEPEEFAKKYKIGKVIVQKELSFAEALKDKTVKLI